MISSNIEFNKINLFDKSKKRNNKSPVEKENLFNQKYCYSLKNTDKNKTNKNSPNILKSSESDNKIVFNKINIFHINKNKYSDNNITNIINNNYKKKYRLEKEEDLLEFGIKKVKKTNIIKKDFIKTISFIDGNNNIKEFRLFKDSDIGFGKKYKIKHLFQDNDINSDDEFIKRGANKNLLNISEALKLIKNKDMKFVEKYLNYIEKK